MKTAQGKSDYTQNDQTRNQILELNESLNSSMALEDSSDKLMSAPIRNQKKQNGANVHCISTKMSISPQRYSLTFKGNH